MNIVQEIERARLGPQELLRYIDRPRDLNLRDPGDYSVLREAEFVAQHFEAKQAGEFWRQMGRLGLRPEMGGGSFLTGTSGEVLYSSIATGTQLNTFTTEDDLQKALPPVIIPAGFFYGPQGATGKSLRVKACGRLGTTGTPTFTFTIRLLTSMTWSAAGIGFSSAAITAGSGVTLAPWFMDIEIIFRTLGRGAASTIAIMGEVRAGTAFAAGGGIYSIPAANTAFTNATYDNSLTNYLFLSAACGTSNASNLCQLELLKVFGEN